MNLKDFDYNLPPDAIARYPAERREDSRLLALPLAGGPLRHLGISDLPSELRAGDLLVLNDTRVVPWRLFGRRASVGGTPGGKVEMLLVRKEGEGIYRAMVSANRSLPGGERILLEGGREATLGPPGIERTIKFSDPETLADWIEREGELPIPPYLNRRAEPLDRERYQTLFARAPGAIAAPTAGLHFGERLIEALKVEGIGMAFVTLHVGPGTFRPVKTDNIENHEMDSESYILPEETVKRIEETKKNGGRVIAVGTTVVRVLETAAENTSPLRAMAGETRLFIRPGHTFRVIDGLLTNFHLPRSTLLMLVAALAGRNRILEAYEEACDKNYRFYSYGDAMLLI